MSRIQTLQTQAPHVPKSHVGNRRRPLIQQV